jgi:hypothetical protein
MKKLPLISVLMMVIFIVAACQAESEPEIMTEQIEESVQVDKEDETHNKVEEEMRNSFEPIEYENSSYFLDNVLSGGPPPDGIPPIDNPEFITVSEAFDEYGEKEQMFLVELGGQIYLYPQSILVWHEIVNMEAYDVAVTYCPLTGSCITYEHPQHLDTTFGTSGELLNSNLVMYDRETGAYISQIDGVGLEKDLEGYTLDIIPTHWVQWDLARENFKDALVLSKNTGFVRNYDRDPYGSYENVVSNNYYDEDGTIFPLLNRDEEDVFEDKHVVLGLKYDGGHLALNRRTAKIDKIVHFTFKDTEFTSVYDERINNVRLFQGVTLELDDNELVDLEGNKWTVDGIALDGQDDLVEPNYFEVMWFAWHAFYPDTEVVK